MTPTLPRRSKLNVTISFDHLVGAHENRGWNFKAKRFGGLEVDGHLEPDRHLYGKLCRCCATENAVNIRGGTTKDVRVVGTVRKQTAVPDHDRFGINGRYFVAGCERYNRRAMDLHEPIR